MKTIKMKYTGKIPVKVPGVQPLKGKNRIEHGDIVEVPANLAPNLGKDPNWEMIEKVKAPPSLAPKPQDTEQEKKEKKTGGK